MYFNSHIAIDKIQVHRVYAGAPAHGGDATGDAGAVTCGVTTPIHRKYESCLPEPNKHPQE